VNHLPKVVTRQHSGWGSNSRPLSHQSDALATRLLSYLLSYVNLLKYVLLCARIIRCRRLFWLASVDRCSMRCTCLCTEVGFGLRKDDPTTLHQLLIDIHNKSSAADVTTFSDPYVSITYLKMAGSQLASTADKC